jgi:hypothetical protein
VGPRTGTRTGTRSQTRSGLEVQLPGGNRPEEEGPTLRKISALQGAGKAEEEGLCFAFSFVFFFFLFIFFLCTPEYLQDIGEKIMLKKKKEKKI